MKKIGPEIWEIRRGRKGVGEEKESGVFKSFVDDLKHEHDTQKKDSRPLFLSRPLFFSPFLFQIWRSCFERSGKTMDEIAKDTAMIYLWRTPDEYPEELIGEYDREISPDRFELAAGEPVSECGSITVRFECPLRDLLAYDVLPNSSMLPIVNERVRAILEDLAADASEFVDATVVASDGDSKAYSVVVVTKKEDLLNRDKSVFSLVPGTEAIMGFTTLRYDGPMVHALARNTSYLPHILVAEQLREALLRANVKGVFLPSPEELYP